MSDIHRDEASLVEVWRYSSAVQMICEKLFNHPVTQREVFDRLTPAAFNPVYMHEEHIYVAGRLFANMSSQQIDDNLSLIEQYRALKQTEAWTEVFSATLSDMYSSNSADEFA